MAKLWRDEHTRQGQLERIQHWLDPDTTGTGIEIAQILSTDPQQLDLLLDERVDWGNADITQLRGAWVVVAKHHPDRVGNFVARLRDAGEEHARVVLTEAVFDRTLGQEILCGIEAWGGAKAAETLEWALAEMIRSYALRTLMDADWTWGPKDWIDYTLRGIERISGEAKAVAGRALDFVIDLGAIDDPTRRRALMEPLIGWCDLETGCNESEDRVLRVARQHNALLLTMLVDLGLEWRGAWAAQDLADPMRAAMAKCAVVRKHLLETDTLHRPELRVFPGGKRGKM